MDTVSCKYSACQVSTSCSRERLLSRARSATARSKPSPAATSSPNACASPSRASPRRNQRKRRLRRDRRAPRHPAQRPCERHAFTKAEFRRLTREIAFEITGDPKLRFRSSALKALQEATEDFFTQGFGFAQDMAVLSNVVTPTPAMVRYALQNIMMSSGRRSAPNQAWMDTLQQVSAKPAPSELQRSEDREREAPRRREEAAAEAPRGEAGAARGAAPRSPRPRPCMREQRGRQLTYRAIHSLFTSAQVATVGVVLEPRARSVVCLRPPPKTVAILLISISTAGTLSYSFVDHRLRLASHIGHTSAIKTMSSSMFMELEKTLKTRRGASGFFATRFAAVSLNSTRRAGLNQVTKSVFSKLSSMNSPPWDGHVVLHQVLVSGVLIEIHDRYLQQSYQPDKRDALRDRPFHFLAIDLPHKHLKTW